VTTTDNRPTPAPKAPEPPRRPLATVRNAWRGLVSMRTALVLLFLLALASVPGALLPQRSLNVQKVDAYIVAHPTFGPLMNRVGLFEVFASPWFAAVYVLLFVSLIGCLLPRSWDHAKNLRARPVPAPRNLARLPHHHESTIDLDVDAAAEQVQASLRRWRTARHEGTGDRAGEVVISAERGHLREWGNLVFHFSLVGLLIGIGVGKLFGYEGQVIALADGGPASEFCNTSTAAYDSFRAGLNEDGTGLVPFCVKVDTFTATYLPSGQASSFNANVEYQSGDDLTTGTWRPYDLRVNSPLRLDGDRVYLLGHGFAPTFTVTYPDGETRTQTLQFRPEDATTFLSSGTLRFDPPAGLYPDADDRRRNQIAVTGLFAPTANLDGTILSSSNPQLNDPQVAVDVLRGDAGLDSGAPQSIFTLDPNLEASGRLVREARVNLKQGESTTLSDGTTVQFASVTQWVSLQTSHDPGQVYVLIFAVTMTAGLMASLVVKRRRVWVRLVPGPTGPDGSRSRTVVEVGGLARTDQAGWGEEFDRLTTTIAPTTSTTPSPTLTTPGDTPR
jgi:cytochrome c biogenesis protein